MKLSKEIKEEVEYCRKMAQQCRDRSEASFQNCDTDGFVSQFCSDLTAKEWDAKANLLENDGLASHLGLFDRESGKRVKAKLVRVYNSFAYKHESKWVVLDSKEKVVNWLPAYKSNDKRSKVWKCGFEEREEMVESHARIYANGTGLGGLSSARVILERNDCGYPKDAVAFDEL